MARLDSPLLRSVLSRPRVRPLVRRAKLWLPTPEPPEHPIHAIRTRHPRFGEAVLADARLFAVMRGERWAADDTEALTAAAVRLAWSSDSFFGLVCYRAKARLQQLGVPGLPRLLHKLAMSSAQICIGDPVVVQPGIYLPHGQVVIDGIVEIDRGVAIRPWVTIGLKEGDYRGATVGPAVRIGTGAKIVGPVTLGPGALVGANAVVLTDVPARATAVGVPARVIEP
jgi:serine O-acetyltransferase